MLMADVFNSRFFEMTALTAAINADETPPQRLAELGIFEEQGVATTSVVIEKQGSTLSLVPACRAARRRPRSVKTSGPPSR